MHMLFQPDHSKRALLQPLEESPAEKAPTSPLVAAAARAGDVVTSSVGQVFRRVSWRRSSARGGDEDDGSSEPMETEGEGGGLGEEGVEGAEGAEGAAENE